MCKRQEQHFKTEKAKHEASNNLEARSWPFFPSVNWQTNGSKATLEFSRERRRAQFWGPPIPSPRGWGSLRRAPRASPAATPTLTPFFPRAGLFHPVSRQQPGAPGGTSFPEEPAGGRGGEGAGRGAGPRPGWRRRRRRSELAGRLGPERLNSSQSPGPRARGSVCARAALGRGDPGLLRAGGRPGTCPAPPAGRPRGSPGRDCSGPRIHLRPNF